MQQIVIMKFLTLTPFFNSLRHSVLFVVFGALLFTDCQKELPNIQWLEGYWSVTHVTHGSETFTPKATTVLWDYYALEGTQGFRKKVMPQAGAIKRTSDDLSPFFLTLEENHYVINFTTRWDQWQEKIIMLSPKALVVEHQEKQYHYKKAQNPSNVQ